MKTVAAFLFFFIFFPVFLSSIQTLRKLLAGPEDDSLYAQQTFLEYRHRAIIELVVSYAIFAGGGILLLWLALSAN